MYPLNIKLNVPTVFEETEIELNFYSGLTVFVGPNGCGKTQVMKNLTQHFKSIFPDKKTRYLSSNRLGSMEQFRSRTLYYPVDVNGFSFGDLNTKNARHDIEVATGDFFVMDERKDVFIKVSERLSTLFNREIFLKWDAGSLKVFFCKFGYAGEYSVAAEASGLVNIISILAALFDDDVKILLIDEPEVSLHPQLQAFLLNEIKKVAGEPDNQGKKMIIMSTHSTEMIDIKRIHNILNYVFSSDDGSLPKQIHPSTPELENVKLRDLIGRIGQIYRAAFFSKRPLLVEGASNSLICNHFDNILDLNLGVAGTQIVPVEGKGQFPASMKLMRLIGKKPIILADLDAFTDDNDVVNLFVCEPKAMEYANEKGHKNLQEFVRGLKSDLVSLCEKHKDDMLDFYNTHPYWVKKDDDEDNLAKAMIRAFTAMLFAKTNEELSKCIDGIEWVSIKNRINVLFECLEKCGCFFLRRGALESYYMHRSADIYDGKPSAALREIEYINDLNKELYYSNYYDIIKVLEYSSLTKKPNETIAIKRELLAELAPLLGQITENTSQSDITTIVRQSRGTEKSLYDYKLINEGGDLSLQVDIKTKILDVEGIPFKIRKGDNVNEMVERLIKSSQ